MAHKKLNELAATAICGNDITSSCLYVSSLTILYAGQFAWIALLMVAAVLYLYRRIYGEVVGALPLNGGAYNVLLNTTSKSNASVAACLTILSYMATAVMSATEAMHYLHHLVPALPVTLATVGLLTAFLLLVIGGISESAIVAVGIFLTHLAAMLLLIGSGAWYVYHHGLDIATVNFKAPVQGGIGTALFLGFCTAMLGISGFESSANFVEEQQPGVFRKTLRNMWVAVSLINPLMALVIVAVLPLGDVAAHKEALLSHMSETTGGSWLSTLISLDAVFVLSGAVLTSYVGVGGLIRRITLDRILPQFLLKENSRGSSPRILTVFYGLCLSVLVITQGELGPLAGVYTISFLLVMIYFGYGNLLLKVKRGRLPRPEYAAPVTVMVAIVAVAVALYGNIKMHPDLLVVFLQYFVPTLLLVYLMLNRNKLLKYLMVVVGGFFTTMQKLARLGRWRLTRAVNSLIQQEFVYFTKGDSLPNLNKVMMYVQENEMTQRLKIVTVMRPHDELPPSLMPDLEVLNRAYPDIHIEFVRINDTFGPDLIQRLSDEWKIPANFMFIGSPSDRFTYRVSELKGVRLII